MLGRYILYRYYHKKKCVIFTIKFLNLNSNTMYETGHSAMFGDQELKNNTVSKIKLKLEDIQDAHIRIKTQIVQTPIVVAKDVGRNFCNVFLKCENMQVTGSSDRLDLLAGYGTLGLEILGQMDSLDAIICPVGTGGLVASILLAVKTLKPSCLIYGVESSTMPTMTRALQENKPVLIPVKPSVADSLAEVIASTNAFNIIRGFLDRMIMVDETWISRAVVNIFEREKIVVEPAAACPVAAIMAGKVPELRGKNVVCILSGGNVNMSRLPQLIERGMLAEGRLVTFCATLADSPGAMAKLLAKVADVGADVRSFVPERKDVLNITVKVLIEISDINHAKELEKKLLKDYPQSQISY